jgi:hypothetical protein
VPDHIDVANELRRKMERLIGQPHPTIQDRGDDGMNDFATLAQEAADYVNDADAEVRRRLLKRAMTYGIKTSEDEMSDLVKAWKRAGKKARKAAKKK